MSQIYLDQPVQWHELVRRCRLAGVCGLDSEFYGLDIKKQSCVGRARCHVWSLAIRTPKFSPLGFHVARGWVLPAAALDDPEIRAMLEDPTIRKEIHNQSGDSHTLANHGIRLGGGRNTLGLIRWKRPELIKQPGRFGLKPLMTRLFHKPPVCEYGDIVNDVRTVTVTKQRKVKLVECSCGVPNCKSRKGHTKTITKAVVDVQVERQEKYKIPLTDIVPGHPRWQKFLEYAAYDAVAALQTAEIANDAPDPAPWPYEDMAERPIFSQELEEAIIDMESVGIPIDVDYCNRRLPEAEADKELDLAWLHKWYILNSGVHGPHRREEVDAIWTSHKQKLELFDDLEFPHSPVWKKGLVKRGNVKLDGVAQEWIGKNYPPAKQLMTKLLHLQRVSSGIKYLKKLSDSGGMVHPVCGPAGDADDRAGAVTGRLGVKGELEATQLPSVEAKDLYEIRKALISWPTRGYAGKIISGAYW